MSNTEYHKLPEIGSSSLKHLEESSLHFENKDLFNMDSPSLNLGTAVHTLTLEPEKFDEEFSREPKNAPRNTTIGKAKWEAFNEALGDKTPIGGEDLEIAEEIARNFRAIMRDYLATGISERSFFSEEMDIPMKCRPDLLFQTADGWIIFDLKTTKDITKMARTIEDYRYDRAMAWYRRVKKANGYNIIGTVLAFAESAGTEHSVKLRMLNSEDLATADTEIDELLQKHQEFKKTGRVTGMIKPIEIFAYKKSLSN